MKRVSLLALAVFLSACGTKKCKSGTLSLTLDFDHATTATTAIDLTIMVGSLSPATTSVSVPAGKTSTTVEVDFPAGYPGAESVDVQATASINGENIGGGAMAGTLGTSCGSLVLEIALGSTDSGVPDLSDGGIDDLGDGAVSPGDME